MPPRRTPLSLTEPHPLSPLDHLFIGHVLSLVLHSPHRLEAQRLESSLEEVLRVTPLLAGGLVEREDGRYGIGPLGGAVERLEVREVPALPERLDGPRALGELLPRLGTGPGQPLLAARLTQAPAGALLGVTVSHAVMDGYSFFMFLRLWSRAMLGRPFEAPPTDRRLLAVEARASTAPLTPEAFWRGTGFTWRPEVVRGLDVPEPASFGTRLTPPEPRPLAGGAPLSDNDVLCAWLLQGYGEGLAGPEGLAVALPIDYRRSHGGLPRNYLGNAVRAAPLWLPRDVLEREPLPALAARVQRAIQSCLGGDAARDSLACLEQLLREQGPQVLRALHLVDPLQGFLMTNISRLPFGLLEFGQGPPAWAHLPALEARTAAIQQADDGVEISLHLPAASARG